MFQSGLSQIHQLVMTSLQVGLLQPNAHGKNSIGRHLGSLRPLVAPVSSMSLVEGMSRRDVTVSQRTITSNWASHDLKGQTGCETCQKQTAKHLDYLFQS